MRDPQLLSVYASWADELRSRYRRVSKLFRHGPSIGRAREAYLADVLSRALPAPLTANHGAIYVPGHGAGSEQDILVIDRSVVAPVEEIGDFGIYYRDSVLACVEVKSKLTVAELRKGVNTLVRARRVGAGGSTQYVLFAYETSMSAKRLLAAVPNDVEFFDNRPDLIVVLGQFIVAITAFQPRKPDPRFTLTAFRPKHLVLDLTLLELIDTVLCSKTGSPVEGLAEEVKEQFVAVASREFVCPDKRPGQGLGTNVFFRR